MGNITLEKLNQDAMQIIMHAGDARKLLMQAIDALCNDENDEAVLGLWEQAKHELAKAHNIQTNDIQDTITEENQITCLLFTHAQDTLMTINSEMLMVKNMIKMYRKLEGDKNHV